MSDQSKPKILASFRNRDDFDGQYTYKKFSAPSRFFVKLFGLKKFRVDRRKKAYGRIKKSIFFYVTTPMIFVFGMMVWVVGASFANIIPYYETNIALNGIIISFLIFGVLKTFHNSFLLYKTANFFCLIEDVTRQETIPIEDIYKLRRSLEREGRLVNTVAMNATVDYIEKFGHPNFNDQRARLIKSKLGFRVSKNKANVSYIAGILVMLGLLGTFLGLLKTIDAVGDALKGMSNIGGGGGGDVGVEEMSLFIGSLAKPLDGMGLAFSSSLFGLSGSLLIGFFLYLGGTPQNAFIENVGRWIDDRIPLYDPDKEEKNKKDKVKKVTPVETEQGLKEWLTGFVNMSVKTNKTITSLCQEISRSTEETQKIWEGTEAVHQTQQKLIMISEDTNAYLQKIDGHNASISETIPEILGATNATLNNVTVLKENSQAVLQELPTLNNKVSEISVRASEIDKGVETMSSGIFTMSSGVSAMSSDISTMSKNIEAERMASSERIELEKTNHQVLNLIKTVAESSYKMQTAAVDADAQKSQKILQEVTNTQHVMEQMLLNLQKMVNQPIGQEAEASLKMIEGNLSDMNTSHAVVSDELKTLLSKLGADPYAQQTKTLVTLVENLDAIISDLNTKFKDFIGK